MSDYRMGYLDAIFERQRVTSHTFMYNAGYDAGIKDMKTEEVSE